jgi:predicted nuclease with TOPRIM domain
MSLEWVTFYLVVSSLVFSVVTLAIASGVLRSTRRSERAGDERLEILREQQQRLKLWGEERRLLLEELARQRSILREQQERLKLMYEEHRLLGEELERERSAGNGVGRLRELPAPSESEQPKLWRWWLDAQPKLWRWWLGTF